MRQHARELSSGIVPVIGAPWAAPPAHRPRTGRVYYSRVAPHCVNTLRILHAASIYLYIPLLALLLGGSPLLSLIVYAD